MNFFTESKASTECVSDFSTKSTANILKSIVLPVAVHPERTDLIV
jgi:hypothetical protein